MKKQLNAKQTKAIELLAVGMLQKDVASAVLVHEDTVNEWMQNTDFRRLVNEKARESVHDFVLEQIQHLVYLSRFAEKEQVRFNASKELLYMAGMKPVDKIEQIGDTTIRVDIEDATDTTKD